MSYYTTRQLELLKEGAEIAIFFHGGPYASTKWKVQLEKEHDGTTLKIRVEGETLAAAVEELHTKFHKATGSGLRELALPQLEYNPAAPEGLGDEQAREHQEVEEMFDDPKLETGLRPEHDDDEIPF